MKTRKVCTIIMVFMAVVLIVGAVVWANTPERKAFRFVDQHSTELSEILDNEQPIPVTLSGKHYNNWDAEHPMDEFILHTWGNTYYGCYYSPDDIPLAFQNYNVSLIADGKDCWQWSVQGDNQGITKKIADKWYYFEASF